MTFFYSARFPFKEKCPTIAVTFFYSARFPFKEKCPTIAVTFFFFFSSDYNPHTDRSTFYNSQFCAEHLRPSPPKANFTPKGPPFHFFTFSRKHTKPDVPKGSPLWIFFGTVRLFFENFFFRKQNGMFGNKSRRVPPFTFFGTMRLLLKKIFFQKFQFFSKKSVLRFLSLRYGADFRRSRLVLQTNHIPHTDRSIF